MTTTVQWRAARVGKHYSHTLKAGEFVARVTRSRLSRDPWYRWRIEHVGATPDASPVFLDGAATLPLAKHAAVNALATLAADGRWNMED